MTQTQGLARMTDGAQIRWIAPEDRTLGPPVVMLHGGPGLPDYLGDVAAISTTSPNCWMRGAGTRQC
ncbi:pimeloyl-ACP methyl ester carboxylesterase [Catenulispora sp. EB89]|uniref:hypothetical protein n=1 Tax=Catenulispora sp. EB89 TaxID=3156257 RepID=UPI003516606E